MSYREDIQKNFKGVIDCTLREGEQFAGRYMVENNEFVPFEFDYEKAATILSYLFDIGINYAEVPNPLAPGMSNYIAKLLKLKKRPKLLCHIRNNSRDVKQALELGVDGINILTIVDTNRLSKIKYTLSTYLKHLEENISYAKGLGVEVRVSVEHAWSSNFSDVIQVYSLADSLKVHRIGVADTKGIATHWDVADVIGAVKKTVKHADIEVHFHNDCMGAVSNAVEAVRCGAHYVDTTLCGIGERTGITPLSVFLYRLHTINSEITNLFALQKLKELESYLANVLNIDIPFNIITSDNAFTHKAGIHLDAMLNIGPQVYELTDPELVGNSRHLITGSRISGKTTKAQVAAVEAASGN